MSEESREKLSTEESNTQSDYSTSAKVFNPQLIKKGAVIFIAISILTFVGIFIYTNTGDTLAIWSDINIRYILLAFVFVAVDLYLGGLRNHIFIREFLPGISQRVSIRANLANIFMGAVTPSQSGGGPAQWYVLYRNGISIPDSLGTSFYNWISTLIFFPLTGAMAILILQDKVPEGFILHLTRFGFSIFTTLFIVIILGLLAPKVLEWVIGIIARLCGMIYPRLRQFILDKGITGLRKLTDYRHRYLALIRRKPQLMLQSFLLTVLLYFNKYSLAYIIVLAFGLDVDFWTVIAIQAVVYLLLYFAPSPGGSGIAELSISALMTGVVGSPYVASFTLLYRSFLVFVPAIIGAYVVLRQLSKE